MGILGRREIIRLAAILLIVCSICAGFPYKAGANSGTLQLHEQKIKAGLIYNFLKYTQWKMSAAGHNGPLQVCLLGGDPFGGYLSPLQGRTAHQQPINIVSVINKNAVRTCQMVIIHRDMERSLNGLLQTLQEYGVLTVSDMPGFARRGGMVELATGNDNKIHLYINKSAVEAAGLEIQERLLKLAELKE